jgi:hypothetical protein
MVEQQQERSSGLVTLAALSLASQLGLYVLLAFNSCSGEMCGLGLLGALYALIGIGALLGIVAWLGATVGAARRHDSPTALSIGLLPPVALANALLVNRHDAIFFEQVSGQLALFGAWALFHVATVILLAICVMRRQALQRIAAVAGLVLAVAVLVVSNLNLVD